MYHHDPGFENTFSNSVYERYGITLNDSEDWAFQNGFSKGDIIFVLGAKNIEIGDVIIFNGGEKHPLIHRVIKTGDSYATKGDNYKTNPDVYPFDKNIHKDAVIGKALFRYTRCRLGEAYFLSRQDVMIE